MLSNNLKFKSFAFKAAKILNQAEKIVGEISNFKKMPKKNIVDIGKIGIVGFSSLATLMSEDFDEFDEFEEYKNKFHYFRTQQKIVEMFFLALKNKGYKVHHFQTKKKEIYEFEIKDYKVMVHKDKGIPFFYGFYFELKNEEEDKENYKEISKFIRDVFIENYGNSFIVVRHKKDNNTVDGLDYFYPERFVFEEEKIFSSNLSNELYVKYQKYIDKNINRSVIFLGNPGTGKTSLMKHIACNLSKKDFSILSIKVDQNIANEFPESLNVLFFLKPDVILIDDFDRLNNIQYFLSNFEEINKFCKLLMISVNDINGLDPAMLRPGRFDEIITIDKIDDGVLNSLVEDVKEEFRDQIKNWPVAYIAEFKKIKDVMGEEIAYGQIKDLQSRIDFIDGKYSNPFEPQGESENSPVVARFCNDEERF
jgi:hypothetical protein